MPIQHSFRNSEEIVKPEYMKEKYHKQYDYIILTFQSKTLPGLLKNNLVRELPDIHFGSSYRKNHIYELVGLENTLFFLSPISAPMAVGMLEEICCTMGVKNIIMYGTCGTLDKSITAGKVIIPTIAYRDEGTSYHYLPASDFVDVVNNDKVYTILNELNLDLVKGAVWTTDAFYRETKEIFEERKKQGCIAVEMEVSAVQAFALYRNLNFYNFLYSADNLDSTKWETRLLGEFTVEDRIEYFLLAKEIVKKLAK